MKEICPYCLGTGLLTKQSHVVYDLEGLIKKVRQKSKERSLIVKCHPAIAQKFKEGKIKTLTRLQLKYMIRLNLIEDESVPLDEIKLFSKKTQLEITDDFK
jgi:Ribonuclease G/E